MGPVLWKHYGLVINGFYFKLVCLSKPVKVTEIEKTPAYYEIWPFSVNYKSAMFYCTGSGSQWKHLGPCWGLVKHNCVILFIVSQFVILIYYDNKKLIIFNGTTLLLG